MQTFLPYPDFKKSAECLDNKRLGKQRVEAWQILNIIDGTNPNSRWRNHPAVKMWKGYKGALALYGIEICREWIRRGFRDSLFIKFVNKASIDENYDEDNDDTLNYARPPWFGDEAFHKSHQSNLVRKNPVIYNVLFKIQNDLPYIWPVK